MPSSTQPPFDGSRPRSRSAHVFGLIPGLVLCALLAAAATALSAQEVLARHGLSALTVAIALGMVLANASIPWHECVDDGVQFSKQTLLRLGVVFFGLRLTVTDIAHVGVSGALIDVAVMASVFGLAWLVGVRLLKLDRASALLIGAGSAICGAAAVLAAAPVLRARTEQVTVAVATVVVFGTLATFAYPLLYDLHLHTLPAAPAAFGLYAGSTIHEVAQVVAAAREIGPDAAKIAVIAKMLRVMMLAPALLVLSFAAGRNGVGQADGSRRAIAVPGFALAFIGMVLLNSSVAIPNSIVSVLNEADTFVLAMAMAALGLATRVTALRAAGMKPLILAGALFLWLIVGGAAINRLFGA